MLKFFPLSYPSKALDCGYAVDSHVSLLANNPTAADSVVQGKIARIVFLNMGFYSFLSWSVAFHLVSYALSTAGIGQPGAPVIFLPGYSGNTLLAKISDEGNVPQSCKGLVPVDEVFSVIYNVTLLASSPQCIYSLMSLNYDSSSTVFSDMNGVEISVKDFGGFSGFSPVYMNIPKTLQSWGYTIGLNAFGAPYDYRYMSKKSLSRNGFILAMKNLVEQAFNVNKGKRVVVIGHSNGGPTLLSFLSAMDQSWKDNYIAALIGLSGNYLGQMNAVLPFIDPDESGEKEMTNSWEAQYLSAPWGSYDGVSNLTVVTTYAGIASKESYFTAKTDDIVKLLESGGRSDWAMKYRATHNEMDRSTHPGVSSYCLYGSEVETTYAFTYDGNVLENPHSTELFMDGDGNQDIIDNRFCESWKSENENTTANIVTEAQGFPGVHHMEMYSDDAVLSRVHEILELYA